MSFKTWFWQDEKYLAKIKELEKNLAEFQTDNAELKLKLERVKENHHPEIQERVSELEVKMAKLWGLLTEKDLKQRDKLTKMGRFFGGKLRD